MVAATLVILSHSFPLSLAKIDSEPVFQLLGITLGHIAVDIFFVTSGFLVLKSLMNSSSLTSFLVARVLRIYPALLVSVLICIFIGSIITDISFIEYISHSESISYFLYNSTMIFTDYQFLPGVFFDAPFDRSVNGSLYTLPWELRMYTILFAIGLCCALIKDSRKKNKLIATIVFSITIVSLTLYLNDHLSGAEKHWFYTRFYRFTATFFLGASFYLLRNHIALKANYFYFTLGALLIASLIGHNTFFVVYVLLSPYAILCAAYLPDGRILNYNKFGDYSYGTYIYAWPIQQLMATYLVGITPVEMTLFASMITTCLAVLSWKYIEKPSLALKAKLIGRKNRLEL